MYPHGIPWGDNSRDISYMSHRVGMESPTVYGSNSTFLWTQLFRDPSTLWEWSTKTGKYHTQRSGLTHKPLRMRFQDSHTLEQDFSHRRFTIGMHGEWQGNNSISYDTWGYDTDSIIHFLPWYVMNPKKNIKEQHRKTIIPIQHGCCQLNVTSCVCLHPYL